MERHHGNVKKAERDATLTKISEGTDWGEIGQTLPSHQVQKA
jgi:hypothetical protein